MSVLNLWKYSFPNPHRYRWIFYINPNYFGLSSVAYFVLSDFETDCTGNQLECYLSSGPYVLNQFFFDKINPYLHIVVSVFSPNFDSHNHGTDYHDRIYI